MSEKAYEVVHIDDLDRFPVDDEGLLWRPVRRRLGITAFGTNAYTAEAGHERVVEEHFERDGAEELYFVASGRATTGGGGAAIPRKRAPASHRVNPHVAIPAPANSKSSAQARRAVHDEAGRAEVTVIAPDSGTGARRGPAVPNRSACRASRRAASRFRTPARRTR